MKIRQVEWSVQHTPAAAAQATIGRAADANKQHVCTGFTVSVAGAAAAPVTPVRAVLRDGATGAGTILWSGYLACLANEAQAISFGGAEFVGTKNVAMTLEFTAAPPASTFECVAMTGYSTDA